MVKLFLILLILPFALAASQSRVDSLELSLEKTNDITEKINLLNTLSQEFLPDSLEKSIYYAKKSILLARENKLLEQEIEATDILGYAFYLNDNYRDAINCFLKTSQHYANQNNSNKLIVAYNRIGVIYHTIGFYDKALEFILKAIKVAKNSDNKTRLSQAYNNIGLVYAEIQQLDQAFDFFQKALTMAIESDDQMLISYSYNNIGIAYKNWGQYDKAILSFYKSLDIKKELSDSRGIANSLANIGDVYWHMGEYQNALSHFFKSLEISKAINDNYSNALNNLYIGKAYMKTNEFIKSENALNNSYEIASKLGLIDFKKDIYEQYALLYKAWNKHSRALDYHIKFSTLKDSLINNEKNKIIIELEAAYEKEKTQRENEWLRYQNKLNEIQLSKNKTHIIILIFVSLFVIFSFIYLYFKYKSNKKRKDVIEEKNREIEKYNEELTLLNSELEKRVEERTEALGKEISDKQRAFDSLKEALTKAEEANSLKDAFLANINHEIRTPLSAIIGLAEVLKSIDKNTVSDSLDSYIEGILKSSNRLLTLLNNIIDFSRIQTNDLTINLSSCDVNEIVINTVELFRFSVNEKKLDLELFLGNVFSVVADKTFLSKVISDIIDNAVKYTSEGKIEIHSGYITHNNEVYIKIIDTGIGIDEKYMSEIFNSFQQESKGFARLYEGAGLGLPMAKRLIKMMKGRIELSSKKNFGTTVTIYMPADHKTNEQNITISYETNEISDNELKSQNLSVLIIEDDPFNALFISAILEQFANVKIAENGEIALQTLEESINTNDLFNIIIIDINLPKNWDGVSLMNSIKEKYEHYQKVPFIAQTAYSLNSDQWHLAGAGFNEVLVKPIDSTKLRNIVKKYLLRSISNTQS